MPRRQGPTSKPSAIAGLAVRRALYLRVSTEDQRERQTIKAQESYLRSRTEVENQAREMQGLAPIVIVGVYRDDGISGTIPIGDRPDGARFLADARSGAMDHVLAYRLDRVGRSLRVLMDAHDTLDTVGVAIMSGTEPFDTSTPFGRAMFGFLGVMAELERSTIAERTAGGRARAVRAGRWTQGPIPFGYDLDDGATLMPSGRIVDVLGITEAELARQIFSRVADEGQSAAEIARWLNAVGVPTTNRYRGGGTRTKHTSTAWGLSRTTRMLHNPIYKGTFRSRTGGGVDVPCAALVTPDAWERAQASLRAGLSRPPGHATRYFPLTGMLRCAGCGGALSGSHGGSRKHRRPYYSCNARWSPVGVRAEQCQGVVHLPAEWIEATVWGICLEEANRDDNMERLQALYQERQGEAAGRESEREAIMARLGTMEAEKAKVVRLYRKSLLSETDADAQLAEIGGDIATLKAELARIDTKSALDDAMEERLAAVARGIAHVRALAQEALQEATPEEQRILMDAVVESITVQAQPGPKRARKRATVLVRTYLGGVRTLDVGPGAVGVTLHTR